MFQDSHAFSGFSVNNLSEANEFYGTILGLDCTQDGMGLTLKFVDGGSVFVYEKPDHTPAAFTILNFPVDDIDAVVAELEAAGIRMEHYELGQAKQDEKGILRGKAAKMGPDIAWFKDPAGNTLAVLSN
jgi:predicted enzyme related to lactoylglutathione lyase